MAGTDVIAQRIARNDHRCEDKFSRAVPRRGVLVAIPLVLAVGAHLAACQRAAPAVPAVGGPFRLVDQNGAAADQHILDGKWSLVFFGYTFCPDVCPMTLTTLAQALERLGPRAKDVQVVFVSVDPQRDTPAQLKTYLSSPAFPRGAIGLTGSPDEVAHAAQAYHVYYKKAGGGANYSVDHTAIIYLMDPRGRFDRPIAEGVSPEETARQIGDAMRGA